MVAAKTLLSFHREVKLSPKTTLTETISQYVDCMYIQTPIGHTLSTFIRDRRVKLVIFIKFTICYKVTGNEKHFTVSANSLKVCSL